MKLTMLPAAEGDALWIEWGSDDDRRQLLVDMGVHATGKAIRTRLAGLPPERRKIELLVVTHVDTDHIYGVLSGLVDEDPLAGLEIGDVWFNGWTHLAGGVVEPARPLADEAATRADASRRLFGDDLESYGGRQGEQFSIWLRDQPWNRRFGGSAVVRAPGQPVPVHEFDHRMKLTILGPTPDRLSALRPKWKKAVADAIKAGALKAGDVSPGLAPAPPDLEPMGRRRPKKPRLETAEDLQSLADTAFDSDSTAANGSSIALLLECEGNKIVLAGDAFAGDLVNAFSTLGDGPLEIAAFKLPHHGSQNNVSVPLVQAVKCPRWMISTNGVKHFHPDAAAIARIVRYAAPDTPQIHFNEPSIYNRWWANGDWQRDFGYTAHYGDGDGGLTLDLPSKPA